MDPRYEGDVHAVTARDRSAEQWVMVPLHERAVQRKK